MLSILVVCAGGISTSFLVQNVKKAMTLMNIEGEIKARAITDTPTYLNEVDIVLIAPQAQFLKTRVEEMCAKKDIPVGLIDPADYGEMNGEKIINFALSLMK